MQSLPEPPGLFTGPAQATGALQKPIEGMVMFPLSELAPGTQAWLKTHPLPAPAVVHHLLDMAALSQWQLAEKTIPDPRVRKLAAYVASVILTESGSTVSAAELLAGYRAHLGAAPWPGSRRVQALLVSVMLALFGAGRCNGIRRQGKAVRGWRGVRLVAPLPPNAELDRANAGGGLK